jgi:hypothetical protein
MGEVTKAKARRPTSIELRRRVIAAINEFIAASHGGQSRLKEKVSRNGGRGRYLCQWMDSDRRYRRRRREFGNPATADGLLFESYH